MTKKEFLDAVAHEIKMLKQHATPYELNGLWLTTFDPDEPNNCIYGQITGACNTPRAKELMDLCCIKEVDNTPIESGINFSGIKPFIEVEEYKGQDWATNNKRHLSYFSALETYIYFKDAKINHVISFLRGEINELKLY